MKIMVVMGEYPADERERRRQAVLKCASPGTEIGFGNELLYDLYVSSRIVAHAFSYDIYNAVELKSFPGG